MKTQSDDYPLPPGWKKAVSKAHGDKPYFINQETKETSWIDPRDKYWKKMTWAECGPDEIPYGWEVVTDSVVGRYFIDHINKRNLLDDPRETKPIEQIQEVKNHIEKTTEAINVKKNTLRLKKDEIAKLKQALQQEAKADTGLNKVEEEAKVLEEEIATSQQAVKEITTVVETLEQDQGDQLARQQQIQNEIDEVKAQLAQQTEIRSDIHQQLSELKSSYEKAKGDEKALKQIAQRASQVKVTQPAPAASVAGGSHAKKAEGDGAIFGMQLNHIKPMTRVEREMELLSLKRQLELEKGETERLKGIASQAKDEIDKALAMPAEERSGKKPQWIKLLNDNASKSQTIRFNVKEKQQIAVENGGVMSFRDKLLFFTASPLSK